MPCNINFQDGRGA